ncbi:MAG: B12-binding domain-containing radical SAM protein, partial [Verrucomicrobia bacterium]|nr:B12-binding domain-containing radical SAM protein [Verrucomicrobiota bacterium]
YWDLVANSGNFIETTPWLWKNSTSPFASFMRWSDWLYKKLGRCHSIGLINLAEMLFQCLTAVLSHDKPEIAAVLWRDYSRSGRAEIPGFLRPWLPANLNLISPRPAPRFMTPKRQARHLTSI